jgi:hypothetical protein
LNLYSDKNLKEKIINKKSDGKDCNKTNINNECIDKKEPSMIPSC